MNRDQLIVKIAESRTDNATLESLMDFFYQHQLEHLEELSDDELQSIELED
jgi:hypothetical protein